MKKIQVESPMRKAAEDRIEAYQPVYDCLPLLPESGSGEASYTNLLRLKNHGLRVVGVDVTPTGVVVVFETGENYFATGFKIVEENDDRTMHFAQFLADCVGGDADAWEHLLLTGYKSDFVGGVHLKNPVGGQTPKVFDGT